MKELTEKANRLTDRELICQLIMVDIPETYAGRDLANDYQATPWGGVILFAKNIKNEKQLKELNKNLKDISCSKEPYLPMFIGSDHEGGIVTRFSFATTTPLCGNMALGATDDPKNAEISGQICAADLLKLGFNINFAPVADVNSNPMNPIIGARSFGENPQKVADFVEHFIKGTKAEGMITCAKHFPGHGDVSLDSHFTMPAINKTIEELEACEIVPFKRAIDCGVDMIMTSHIYFEALDKEACIPATLSQNVLTGYLRNKLRFDGVIITDSMSMQGIKKYFGYSEAAVMAFEAGADIVMLCGSREEKMQALETMESALTTGRLSRDLLQKSFLRTARLREKANVSHTGAIASETEQVIKEITSKSITVVRNERNIIPLKQGIKVLLVSPEYIPPSPQGEAIIPPTLQNFAAQRAGKVDTVWFGIKSGEINIKELDVKAGEADCIILCLYANGLLGDAQKNVAAKIQSYNEKTIVISLSSPYILSSIPWVSTYINCYNHGRISMECVAGIIFGEYAATGISPVTIPGL